MHAPWYLTRSRSSALEEGVGPQLSALDAVLISKVAGALSDPLGVHTLVLDAQHVLGAQALLGGVGPQLAAPNAALSTEAHALLKPQVHAPWYLTRSMSLAFKLSSGP